MFAVSIPASARCSCCGFSLFVEAQFVEEVLGPGRARLLPDGEQECDDCAWSIEAEGRCDCGALVEVAGPCPHCIGEARDANLVNVHGLDAWLECEGLV